MKLLLTLIIILSGLVARASGGEDYDYNYCSTNDSNKKVTKFAKEIEIYNGSDMLKIEKRNNTYSYFGFSLIKNRSYWRKDLDVFLPSFHTIIKNEELVNLSPFLVEFFNREKFKANLKLKVTEVEIYDHTCENIRETKLYCTFTLEIPEMTKTIELDKGNPESFYSFRNYKPSNLKKCMNTYDFLGLKKY